jgi:hypothetical protein
MRKDAHLMSHSPSAWYKAYEAAVLETDFSKRHERVETALNAIDKRLDKLAKLGEEEFAELQVALRSLLAMTAEMQSA